MPAIDGKKYDNASLPGLLAHWAKKQILAGDTTALEIYIAGNDGFPAFCQYLLAPISACQDKDKTWRLTGHRNGKPFHFHLGNDQAEENSLAIIEIRVH